MHPVLQFRQSGVISALLHTVQALHHQTLRFHRASDQCTDWHFAQRKARRHYPQHGRGVVPAIERGALWIGPQHHAPAGQTGFFRSQRRRHNTVVSLERIPASLVDCRRRTVNQLISIVVQLDAMGSNPADHTQKSGHALQSAAAMRPLDPRQQLGRHRVGTRDPLMHAATGIVSLQADQQKGQKSPAAGW